MTHEEGRPGPVLINDTVVNVVGLLKSEVGDRREYALHLDVFSMGDELTARNTNGSIRLTRLRDRILVDGNVAATVELECVRCLGLYGQPVRARFSEEFWQTVDVRTGSGVEPADAPRDDEDLFSINENHELDITEAMRQHLVLALPMRPFCGIECPGPDKFEPDVDEPIDDRMAALAQLLNGAGADD